MKRRVAWAGGVVAVVVACSVGLASGTTSGTRLSCLDWASRTKPASTTSTSWRNISGMSIVNTLAQNFAVQVSGSVSGAPVRFRVRDTFVGGTFTLKPGATTVSATGGPSFSFTWVGTNPAEHQHTFHLQWRRAGTSGTATFKAGAMTAVYEGAPTPTVC